MGINEEIQMFGCTLEEFRKSIERTPTFKVSGPGMIAMSILSDAQEHMARDNNESARQAINRAKWIISEYNCGLIIR